MNLSPALGVEPDLKKKNRGTILGYLGEPNGIIRVFIKRRLDNQREKFKMLLGCFEDGGWSHKSRRASGL